jgi:hypothetical protein
VVLARQIPSSSKNAKNAQLVGSIFLPTARFTKMTKTAPHTATRNTITPIAWALGFGS